MPPHWLPLAAEGSFPGGKSDAGCTGAGCVVPPAGVCGDPQNDPQNCGACGHACGSQACNAGACGPAATIVPIAAVSPYLNSLAVDTAFVYFTDRSFSGGVYRAPIAGGTATLLAADSTPHALVLSGGSLLFGADPSSAAVVRKISTAGGAVKSLATCSASAQSLAADAANVFWTTYYTYDVAEAPMAGGPAVTLGTTRPALAVMAVDATNLYWIESGNIVFVPKLGGSPSPLVSGMNVETMILYGGYLYFGAWKGYNDAATGLYRVPVAGGAPTAIATGLFNVTTLVTDGTTVYFADGLNDFSILRRAPAAGGGKFVSLSGYLPTPLWSAIDGSWVYWNDQRSIYRTAR